MSKADVVWYNILDDRPLLNSRLLESFNATEHNLKKTENLLPLELFLSMESEINFPEMLHVYKAGLDFSADYRIWEDNTPHADIGTPYLFFPPIQEAHWNFSGVPYEPKRKDVLVAAIIGNCRAKNNRTAYLSALMKEIEVHSYGNCLHNIEQPKIQVPEIPNLSQSLKKIEIAKQYHYIFCPENSNTESYVTEKVYDALRAGSVPIYFGAPDIERFIPHPDAIIQANKFASPAELANYLKFKSQPGEYEKFFEWKKKPFQRDFKTLMQTASVTFECKVAKHLQSIC